MNTTKTLLATFAWLRYVLLEAAEGDERVLDVVGYATAIGELVATPNWRRDPEIRQIVREALKAFGPNIEIMREAIA